MNEQTAREGRLPVQINNTDCTNGGCIQTLQDACARVVRIAEAVVDGDLYFAGQVAEGLELDLVVEIQARRAA